MTIRPVIPDHLLSAALENPNALGVAYSLGTLEMVSMCLTTLGVVIALFGFGGFWMVRREALSASRDTAGAEIPQEVRKFMQANGRVLVGECLRSPELLSIIEESISELGMQNASQADSVEHDRDEPEATDHGHPGAA